MCAQVDSKRIYNYSWSIDLEDFLLSRGSERLLQDELDKEGGQRRAGDPKRLPTSKKEEGYLQKWRRRPTNLLDDYWRGCK